MIEALHAKYRANPDGVDPSWRYFFEGMDFASTSRPSEDGDDVKTYRLTQNYRQFGHQFASVLPFAPKPVLPDFLSLPTLGPTDPLKQLADHLKTIYCGSIGFEYMHVESPPIEEWIQGKIESGWMPTLSSDEEIEILFQLMRAELFEHFIHTRYTGQKRFSLEGNETLIPLLTTLLETGSALGVTDCILGMAHRGRLNVLGNILKKPYPLLFRDFEEGQMPTPHEGAGDVKYHKGFSNSFTTSGGRPIQITLVANPSHLESVDPVAEGICRGKQEFLSKTRLQTVPVLIHGDAALAGQGVVYETLQLSQLPGYTTGGTIHIVINNQIGFTTSPKDSRSTPYCTAIARAFRAPVLHVNAEDPIAVIFAAQLAMQLRQQFQCDLFIDLCGYRKYGHNESDEPTFTQPLEYAVIRAAPSITTLFKEKLLKENKISPDKIQTFEATLKAEFSQPLVSPPVQAPPPVHPPVSTGVDLAKLKMLTERLCEVPSGFHIHPKVGRLAKDRLNMLDKGIDWGLGESLAYASLLAEGIPIRLSGQDVGRGTFSHRHAIWVDHQNGTIYSPLNHLTQTQAPCEIFNSPLSEFAVLGFDFGYSIAHPKALVIWEAQFGDFANSAQVIIDQYIASAEQKWGWNSSCVLLLPHGYEGQGPEHSSARIERFLQLASDENMRIVNTASPQQLFHLLRTQALNPQKKPLVLFTPKALLRHPDAISPLQGLTTGQFQPLLDDPTPPANPKQILLCTGKIYYDLLAERKKRQDTTRMIVSVEQLYPFPEALRKYIPCSWVQEEHQNMGAWEYIHSQMGSQVNYIGRPPSASPATGFPALHQHQFQQIMNQAFT